MSPAHARLGAPGASCRAGAFCATGSLCNESVVTRYFFTVLQRIPAPASSAPHDVYPCHHRVCLKSQAPGRPGQSACPLRVSNARLRSQTPRYLHRFGSDIRSSVHLDEVSMKSAEVQFPSFATEVFEWDKVRTTRAVLKIKNTDVKLFLTKGSSVRENREKDTTCTITIPKQAGFLAR